MNLKIDTLESTNPSWKTEVDWLCKRLGAKKSNPTLFPAYFLKTIFPLIGGHIVVAQTNTKIAFVSFLFPRSLEGKTRVYTLRYHALDESEPWKQDTVAQAVERQAKLGKNN